MGSKKPFYFGNAKADQVRGSGWFVGQFVPAELGLRRQTDVELKWGIHPDGERRSRPWANQNATTISVLIEGCLRVTFHIDGTQQEVTLQTKGDYVAFGPEVVHSWEAVGDTIVLSVRFPSVEVGSRAVVMTEAHHGSDQAPPRPGGRRWMMLQTARIHSGERVELMTVSRGQHQRGDPEPDGDAEIKTADDI